LSKDWPTPLLFLPGNHDIGDNPPDPGIPASQPLDLHLLSAYRAGFGADYWSIEADSWWLIGLDAQLLGTSSLAETEQWEWLSARVGGLKGRPMALLLHKPLFRHDPREDEPHIRYVPRASRLRLLELLAPLGLRLVLTGHTHQYVDHVIDGVRHIWLPSTAFWFRHDAGADRREDHRARHARADGRRTPLRARLPGRRHRAQLPRSSALAFCERHALTKKILRS
jgi:Calcineurin-like phosphoesterase